MQRATAWIFQVICFFRDMCIDAMQTFANVFRGIVNVISNISRDDVEDFASACVVVILCTGAVKMFTDILKRVRNAPAFDTNTYNRYSHPAIRDTRTI